MSIEDHIQSIGKHLFDALGGDVAIVGVAKRAFADIPEGYAVLRGESRTPLFITAVGMDIEEAKAKVQSMHGPYRIPTLIKLADSTCRQTDGGAPAT